MAYGVIVLMIEIHNFLSLVSVINLAFAMVAWDACCLPSTLGSLGVKTFFFFQQSFGG